MSLPIVHIAIEGFTDEIVIRRVLQYVGLTCGLVRGGKGKADLLRNLPKYNAAAAFANWLTVVDLDHDAECAPSYIQILLPSPARGMLLRIPVRAIESWLIADRERLAGFLGISIDNIPLNPDLEDYPKAVFIDLARKTRKTSLREDILPRPNSGGRVGPGYAGRIQEFVEGSKHPWRPEIALQYSDSLRRCITALQQSEFIQ